MCNECEWEEVVEMIKRMDESGKFGWAQDTLEGIKDTIELKEHVTDRQKEAIQNVADARPGWDD